MNLKYLSCGQKEQRFNGVHTCETHVLLVQEKSKVERNAKQKTASLTISERLKIKRHS